MLSEEQKKEIIEAIDFYSFCEDRKCRGCHAGNKPICPMPEFEGRGIAGKNSPCNIMFNKIRAENKKQEPTIFQDGDIVTCAFLNGEHELKKYEGSDSLLLKANGHSYLFFSNGKHYADHDKSLLTIVRRPKKFVKKEVDVFIDPSFKESIFDYGTFYKHIGPLNYTTKAKLIYEEEE